MHMLGAVSGVFFILTSSCHFVKNKITYQQQQRIFFEKKTFAKFLP